MPQHPLHVLFLVESLAKGGAEKVLADLVHGLDKRRIDATVCSIVDCGLYRDRVMRDAHYRSIIHGKGLFYRFMYALVYRVLPARWIYRWWIAGDYDVEVAFTEGFPTRLLAAATTKARRIAWVHVDLEKRPWTQELVYHSLEEEKGAYRHFQIIVHVSKTVREAFERRYGVYPGSIVLYNPVDQDQVRSLAAQTEDVPAHTCFRFLSAGRLEEQKGFDRLIAAFARLRQDGFDAELFILGEGSLRKALEEQAASLGLGDSLSMPGFKKNPYPWIASADLFVCSSYSEGMSTVVTESLVLGTPVLAVECSGIREQLGEGDYGRIVPNDDESLLHGMEDFVSGRESLATWRDRAREGGSQVDYRKAIDRVERLLEEMSMS